MKKWLFYAQIMLNFTKAYNLKTIATVDMINCRVNKYYRKYLKAMVFTLFFIIIFEPMAYPTAYSFYYSAQLRKQLDFNTPKTTYRWHRLLHSLGRHKDVDEKLRRYGYIQDDSYRYLKNPRINKLLLQNRAMFQGVAIYVDVVDTNYKSTQEMLFKVLKMLRKEDIPHKVVHDIDLYKKNPSSGSFSV